MFDASYVLVHSTVNTNLRMSDIPCISLQLCIASYCYYVICRKALSRNMYHISHEGKLEQSRGHTGPVLDI